MLQKIHNPLVLINISNYTVFSNLLLCMMRRLGRDIIKDWKRQCN
ncbi:9059_t:CDS:2 [Cetraspora pellucida]|uniref:9059_t:CDS:1 n=1 Tax=Cetraspora pellucida TaxID=1433469 RepID=A0ACA9K3E7_9GLOM|nr:9059_t:CDS:2 [Cetraspora pellucida]